VCSSDLAASALAAFDSALEKIEAFVDSISLSNLFSTDCANEAKEAVLNTDQLSTEAEVQTALAAPADQQSKSVDPKATEAPAPFAERAEPVPKAVEPGPNLQSAITRYREAQLALDSVTQEVRNRTGRETSAQLASLKQRQTEANDRAMEAKRELNDIANKEGLTMSALPIWGPSYNQPRGREAADPAVIASANATVEDQTKRYVAAVREFDRANAAQLAEKNKQIRNIFKAITPEDTERHRALVNVAREKRSAVTAITAEILPGDRAAIFAKIPYDGVIKN
jgi:hypothetical protein